LREQGLLSKNQYFLVGQKPDIPTDSAATTIAIGKCAIQHVDADIQIETCPPSAGLIYRRVRSVKT
jgi:hypothetical protein